VMLSGHGSLQDSGMVLEGEVVQLALHGEKDGKVVDFLDSGFQYKLEGDHLKVLGKTTLAGNEIPLSYEHTLQSSESEEEEEGWEIHGQFKMDEADLATPIENAGMFVSFMEGKSLAGKLSIGMDFSIGSEKDFDAAVSVDLKDGTLGMGEDAPVLEGIQAGVLLPSLKKKHTKGYHHVTVKKISAWGMEMSRARLDYKLEPSGDIKLKNISLQALGGEVGIDDFTLPGEEKAYTFTLRMKAIDITQLAKLFPEFNGSIAGQLDGVLPIKSEKGEFMPQRGALSLTPGKAAKLCYDAGTQLSDGLDPGSLDFKKMKMVEDSLRDLDLSMLDFRLFDPRDGDKAVVIKIKGQAHKVEGSPPIILNINGFKPDDDTLDFFDLLLRHRNMLDFGL